MKQWLTCYALRDITILFNEDYTWSTAFAEMAKQPFDNNAPAVFSWSDRAPLDSQLEKLKGVLHSASDHYSPGIVLAGAPWNTDQWVKEIELAGVKAPIYIGPLVSGLSELKQLSHYSVGPISTASQYWTDPDDASSLCAPDLQDPRVPVPRLARHRHHSRPPTSCASRPRPRIAARSVGSTTRRCSPPSRTTKARSSASSAPTSTITSP